MPSEQVAALAKVPLFAGIGERELTRLANQLTERSFPEGATITREGQTGVGFFLILEGTALVSVGGEARGTLGPGDYFGEIALIDEGRRSATIVAGSPMRCAGMTAWEFRPFVESHPQVAWTLLLTLVKRLREAEAQAPAH